MTQPLPFEELQRLEALARKARKTYNPPAVGFGDWLDMSNYATPDRLLALVLECRRHRADEENGRAAHRRRMEAAGRRAAFWLNLLKQCTGQPQAQQTRVANALSLVEGLDSLRKLSQVSKADLMRLRHIGKGSMIMIDRILRDQPQRSPFYTITTEPGTSWRQLVALEVAPPHEESS